MEREYKKPEVVFKSFPWVLECLKYFYSAKYVTKVSKISPDNEKYEYLKEPRFTAEQKLYPFT